MGRGGTILIIVMMSRPQKVESYREREIGRKRKIKLDSETDRERTDRAKEDAGTRRERKG